MFRATLCSSSGESIVSDVVSIQLNLLMMSTRLLETC